MTVHLSIPFRIPAVFLAQLVGIELSFQFLSGFQKRTRRRDSKSKKDDLSIPFRIPDDDFLVASMTRAVKTFNSFPDSSCRRHASFVFQALRLSIPFRIPVPLKILPGGPAYRLSIPFRIPETLTNYNGFDICAVSFQFLSGFQMTIQQIIKS